MSLIRADARAIPLVDGCVQCVVTSPPYWGLRDYGAGGQIGLERTPDAYVASLVAVFAEVWRVLKADGTCWLNLGDSVQQKQLQGIPWRVAFALQAAGWYLRSDIIWSKPNPMPESVTDRPTKAHEYIFLLAKGQSYYYDADAIREVITSEASIARNLSTPRKIMTASRADGVLRNDYGRTRACETADGRNKRSVWHVATQSYSGSHFATFPEALIEPCILAGSRLGDLVFDPFCGSGTTLKVAERYGRRAVGTDLSYQDLARKRTAQRGLRYAVPDDVPERAMDDPAVLDYSPSRSVCLDLFPVRELIERWRSRALVAGQYSVECPTPEEAIADMEARTLTYCANALETVLEGKSQNEQAWEVISIKQRSA